MFAENTDYEIMTPSGWKDFKGVTCSGEKITFRVVLENGNFIEATAGHYFFVNSIKTKLDNLIIGDKIDTLSGSQKIIDIIKLDIATVYDIVEVDEPTHRFVANEIYSKNCDEYSYVPQNIAENFWSSISPTLATGGRAIITSTPNTDEDMFAQLWKGATNRYDDLGNDTILGSNGFYGLQVDWDEHPDRDEEWKRNEIAKIGDIRWRREFLCEFITFEETLLNPLKLGTMRASAPISNMGQIRWYEKIKPEKTYVIALDPAMGTGGDYAAIQVFEVPSYLQVAEWRHNGTNIPNQIRLLKEICDTIVEITKNSHNIYWSVENNTIGEAALITIDEMGEENIPGLFVSEPIKKGMIRKYRKGFNTTHSTKLSACSRLKTLIESDRLRIHSGPLISEFKTYVSTASSYRAKPGSTDDLISALLLIIRMIVVLKDWDVRVYNTFKSIEKEQEWEPPMPIFVSHSMNGF